MKKRIAKKIVLRAEMIIGMIAEVAQAYCQHIYRHDSFGYSHGSSYESSDIARGWRHAFEEDEKYERARRIVERQEKKFGKNSKWGVSYITFFITPLCGYPHPDYELDIPSNEDAPVEEHMKFTERASLRPSRYGPRLLRHATATVRRRWSERDGEWIDKRHRAHTKALRKRAASGRACLGPAC